MKFFEFKIPNPNPWRFPSKYPYILLEGPGKILSVKEKELIEIKRKEWQPSKIAHKICQKIKNNVGRTIFIQLENENNYMILLKIYQNPLLRSFRGLQ